ncbi:integrase [Bacilli bacterium PM5-9]|nr:integrase [Bacilli bacterium PM5-9]
MAKDPIKKAKDGTYYFRAHLGFDTNGKRIQKRGSGFTTKKEARDKYYELLSQKENYFEDTKEKISFEDYINMIFLSWYKTQVKQQTYDNRVTIVKHHFKYFSKFTIDEIEPIHVQKWQLSMAKTLKPSYVRGVQGLFSLAMDRAVVLGLAKQNPAKIIGNIRKQKPKINFWTKEEFEKVLSSINKNDYYQFFHYICLWLLFMSGMRIGEATALSWCDIDFETRVLNIDKTLIYKNQNDYHYGEPKTKASKRYIVLDENTISLLKEWKNLQFDTLGYETFILSYNGIPTQKSSLSKAIERYSKIADVHRIRIHDLRHSHASLLIELGENPLIIRDRLGHEEIETTLGTYGHLYPNTNYEVANKLNGILNINVENNSNKILTRNKHTSKASIKCASNVPQQKEKSSKAL